MLYLKRNLAIFVLLFALSMLFGCGSHTTKKAAMTAGWEHTSAFAKMPMAEELAVNGRYEEARAVLDKCIAADPKSFEAHLMMGKVFLMEGMNSEAKQSINTALECDGPADKAWFMLGVIAEAEGVNKEAFDNYTKAMELKPSDSGYVIACAELHAACSDYNLAVDLLRSKSNQLYAMPDLKVALAEMLVRQGEVSEAITVYQKLLLSDSNKSEYLSSLGYCYIINENWIEGAKVFSKLSSNSEGSERDTYTEMLGICSMNSADYVQSLKCYDQLSVNRRDDVDIWLRMGQAALGATHPKMALACAKRVYALQPGNIEAITLAGCAEYLQGDYAKALKTFEQISDEGTSSSFVQMMMTRCYRHLGRESKSVHRFEAADEAEMLTHL